MKLNSTDHLATCAMIHAILLNLQRRARRFKTSAPSHPSLFSVISPCSKVDFNFRSDESRCVGGAQQKLQTLICFEIKTHTSSSGQLRASRNLGKKSLQELKHHRAQAPRWAPTVVELSREMSSVLGLNREANASTW